MHSNAVQAKALRSTCPGCGGRFETIGYGQIPEHSLDLPPELKELRRCAGSFQPGTHLPEGVAFATDRLRQLRDRAAYHFDLAKALRKAPDEHIVFHKPDAAGVPCECDAAELTPKQREKQRRERAVRHSACHAAARRLAEAVKGAIQRASD